MFSGLARRGDTPAPFLSITYGHNTHSTDIVTELTQLRARAVAGMYRVCHGVSAERTRRRAAARVDVIIVFNSCRLDHIVVVVSTKFLTRNIWPTG